ncbi:semaphorin-6C isoform X2 [Thamnophis elegans]|uniref:semaphorin-6C isoform X2 n=1 Tax=Thamnophis elegans TaxID=35005 RepID=UPI0013780A80|nr:semaphorin-6C isoform X2 [Thamnophis elegans]
MIVASPLPALFLFLASAASFPRDLAPFHVVSETGTHLYPSFRGLGGENDSDTLGLDFQSMLQINHTLFVAARDHVFAFDLGQTASSFSPKRHLTWKAQDVENCAVRGKLRDECYNYIKVLVPKNEQSLLACGTNAFHPVCRTYKISNFQQEGEELNGQARCPFDTKQTNVGIFADGNLYSATVADFQASDAVIYRSLGERSPVLRTVKYDSKWLREPHFIHAMEYKEFVYFFFREISVEYTTLGRVIFSRVGRVCKNDMGGSPRVLEKYWTSFLKARLNCSVPGDAFFYFDVLQAVTDVVLVNGRPSVFGVFTTQSNSITGSAVCAFDMEEVERVFGGRFKEQKNTDAGWTPISEDKVPTPRPGSCAGVGQALGYRTSNEFPDTTLSFIKSHPLLDEAVGSVGSQPCFTKTSSRYRLTRLAVDPSAGPSHNVTVLFLGSEDGTVLKVVSRPTSNHTMQPLLLEEASVYQPSRCSVKREDRQVLGLQLDKANHALYVAFSGCVVRMPLSRCGAHSTCRRSCLASRDPYCVWLPSGTCANFGNEIRSGFEQDLENATKPRGNCQEGVTSTGEHDSLSDSAYGVRQEPEATDGAKSVHFTFLIGCVFVAFLLGAFLSGLLVSCYCSHSLQRAKHPGKDPENGIQRPLSLRSLAKMNTLLEGGQAKDGMMETAAPQLYTTLLPSEKELPSAPAKPGVREHPELSALPTPESTPELPVKNMKAIRNQWEKNQNFNNAKDAQGKALPFHAPVPNTFSFSGPGGVPGHLHGYDAPLGGYVDEKKISNSERVLVRPSPLPKGMEVTTLEELLKHLHGAGASVPPAFPPSSVAFANRVQPKVPNLDGAPYYNTSTLPRRLDIPPDAPLPLGLDKAGRSVTHRHSLCGAPKLVNVGGGGGGLLMRQHSLGQAGRLPPALLTRMHSTGSSVPHEGHHAIFLARQHSYGDQGPLPSHAGGIRRSVSLIKPGMAPQSLFQPSSPPAQPSGPFNY